MESICRRDIARVNLDDGILRDCTGVMLCGNDNLANSFGAELYRRGKPVDITGYTVMGYFMRSTRGDTVAVAGTAVGNMAMVELPAACYTYPGAFSLAIKVVGAGMTATVRIVDGMIRQTQTDAVIDPGLPLPSLGELLAQIDAMEKSTAAANAAASAANSATFEANKAAGTANTAADKAQSAADEAVSAALAANLAGENYVARDQGAANAGKLLGIGATGLVTPVDGVAGGGGMPTVYCWGDSLTEGVGGWVATPDKVQSSIVTAYPDMVARTYPCVNLGCRGETIQTIMARQGADPMVVGGFDIPASASEDVVVGYLRGSYYDANRLGLATRSGDVAQPLKESEAGVNPCVIAGVEGELYRDMTPDGEGRYAYRFRRLQDGETVAVPEGSEVETYAMRHYRNGVAVIWMGANGAVASHTAYIEKLKAMIEYGQYSNYLVIIAREYTAQWVLEDANSIRNAMTDNDGVCHLLYLPPELVRRGYTLAGIAASCGVPDTSGWTTTDAIKKNVPLLAYSYGGATEDAFETLHFSAYGYRAIGRLVVERLGQLIGVSSGKGGETGGTETPPTDPGYVRDGEDAFGAFAYKLTKPMKRFGAVVDTGVMLYDTEKDWTIAIRFEDAMTVADNALGSVFELREFFPETETAAYGETAAYLRLLPQTDGPLNYNFAAGHSMGFYFPFDNAPGYTEPTDGYHTAVIAKNGTQYEFYLDGGLAYNSPLTSQVPEAHRTTAKLYLFGRVENGSALNTVSGTIADFRVYNTHLNADGVRRLLMEMTSGSPGDFLE